MAKHLTEQDRKRIQEGLHQRQTYREIAESVGVDRSTISREIKRHELVTSPSGNVCIHRKTCKEQREICQWEKCRYERLCPSHCPHCQWDCERFEMERCEMAEEYPYGCNVCSKQHCKYVRRIYLASKAQEMADRRAKESRRGITLTEEEFLRLNDLFVCRLKKGQSIPVIYGDHAAEMPVSERTIYSYMEQGFFHTDRLVLRRTVQRKEHKKSGPPLKVDKKCHVGRTHEEYLAYRLAHPEETVCEMDSVLGKKGGKCLLTILFTNCDLQLMYLREANTAASVAEIFERLRETLGDRDFRRLFQVLLTDRGSEFTDPTKIEADPSTGEITCRVFYCDPQQTNQKSHCERNHEFIRYILPKATSMDGLDQEKVDRMASHINSYPRKKWNEKSPLDVFIGIYGEEIAIKLGLEKVPTKEILLRPDLIK